MFRAAGLELFRGLLNDQVIDDAEFSVALARAAMKCVDHRLLTDPDLGPGAIAAYLHVSVRTLHRAFANERVTVMGYVQERRLERARAELLSSSSTVSEIAARWHFTDSSSLGKYGGARSVAARWARSDAARLADLVGRQLPRGRG